jgi:AcrR family transcriptional regulator
MPQKSSTEPRKLPQQERSRIAVEAILEATTRILTEEGYEKANTNRIAERAGVSIGSLYQYFPNKDSLMTALMVQHSEEIVELVESKLTDFYDAPVEIVIPEIVKAVIAAHAIDPKLHQVLNEEIPQSARAVQMRKADERIIELLRSYLSRWRDAPNQRLCECVNPQNLDMTVFMLSCTVESLCHAATIEQPGFVADSRFVREVSNLLLLYLGCDRL